MNKIMVVEDDKFFGSIIIELLKDNGEKGFLVRSVQDALKVDLNNISATIIDVMLPNDPARSGITMEETRGNYLSGVALARRIREKERDLNIFLSEPFVVKIPRNFQQAIEIIQIRIL